MNRRGAEGENMAGKVTPRFADRYPGGKPLHSGGEMFQWNKVGQELVGEFVSIKPFKNGHIANLNTEDGLVAFSAPAILAGILDGVMKGTKIAIVYSGDKPTKQKGFNPTKLFEVYELEGQG